jgi:hypothetical protein
MKKAAVSDRDLASKVFSLPRGIRAKREVLGVERPSSCRLAGRMARVRYL